MLPSRGFFLSLFSLLWHVIQYSRHTLGGCRRRCGGDKIKGAPLVIVVQLKMALSPVTQKETRSIVVVFQIKMWRHWRLTCFSFFLFCVFFYFCLRAIRWAIWVRQRITRLPRPLQLHHFSSSIKEAAILISASHHRPTWAFHLTNSIRKRQEPWVKIINIFLIFKRNVR